MKDCTYIKTLLFDYASGKLDGEIAEKVKKHIEQCGECRREYEAQKLYFENLPYVKDYFNASVRDIKAPVMQKIQQEKENPYVYVPKRFHFSYGTAASLVLVAALFIFAMRSGIADKQSFECAETESVDTAEEIAFDGEAAADEYGYSTSDLVSGTGAADNGMAYFSATTTNDAYYDADLSAEKSGERLMMMAAPPEAAEEECVTESVSETEPAEKKMGTQCDEISCLTLEKLKKIVAEKGGAMTWSDFECYEHSDIGFGVYILRYPVSDNFYLTISGVPENEIFEIRLVSEADSNNYITLPDGDIDGFTAGFSN